MHKPDDEFHLVRDGYHYIVPFKCDLCVFRKLKRWSPDSTNPEDDLLIACIQQIHLDAFWSRSKYTVRGNQEKIRTCLEKYENSLGWGALTLMGPSLTSITLDTKWLSIRYYTLGTVAGIQKSIPSSIPWCANFAPLTPTTATPLPRQSICPGPSATPRESISAL
jgi:hypothetical protein